MGDVSPDEQLQVEEMAFKHPEVKTELGAIAASLEAYAVINAVEPPVQQEKRILNSMLVNLGDDRTFGEKQATVTAMPVRQNNGYKYAFAACLALLLVSVVALYNVYNKLQQSQQLITTLEQQNQQFSHTVSLMDHQLDVFRDPTFTFVQLKGTEKSPASQLTLAWSAKKKKVMIDMQGMKLPVTDHSHQYQLWAIVDGAPVDLGVFDFIGTDESPADMKEMKAVSAPQAFAVTIEPRGGSTNPTLTEMVVMSKI